MGEIESKHLRKFFLSRSEILRSSRISYEYCCYSNLPVGIWPFGLVFFVELLDVLLERSCSLDVSDDFPIVVDIHDKLFKPFVFLCVH